MMKMKNIVYYLVSFSVFIIAMIIVFSIRYRITDNVQDENETQKNETIEGISQETYEMLVEECQDEEHKAKALEHLEKDWKYSIQDEIEYNGKIYKSIYIRYLDYSTVSGDIVKNELSYKPEYEEKIDRCMNDNIFCSEDENSEMLVRSLDPADSVNYYNKEKWDVITLERYKEFEFMENWITAALLICDKEGNIEDILTFNGAIGTSLKDNDGKLVWEVFIGSRLDAYIWGEKNGYGEFLGLNGQVSGKVYDIIINGNNDIVDILYVRDSTDNNINDLFTKPYVDTEPSSLDKIYVENQDLTIYEFINEKEQLNNKSTAYFRERFGHEHSTLNGSTYLPVYFTVDGYVILKGHKEVFYCKYPKKDFLMMSFYERNIEFKNMFIDNDVNPELLKELDK